MATPLTAIGKYAGVLMAVMCVLLMFAFVIGDPLMQYAGSGGGVSARDTEVVATWDGGQINERQLDQAVVHRNVLAEFQQTVIQLGARAAIADGVDVQFTGLRVQPIDLPRTREQGVEQSVVRTKIFAQKARDAGMVVSDEMIVDYLRALGFDRVTNDQMRDILSRMSSSTGRRATISFVFDLLREAILANNYLASHSYAFRTILPEERWEDWKKVNKRVVVEAAPLEVSEFTDEVPEPTDEELQAFYEEYKDRTPSPDVLRGYGGVELPSPLPAFATPSRVKLSVLRADFDAAVDRLIDDITDEEIAAYYEENKESFVAADRALFGDDSLFGPSDLLGEDTDEDVMSGDTEEAPAGEADTPADDEAMSDEAASEDEASDDESPAKEPSEEASAAEEPAGDQADAAEEASDNPLRNNGDAAVEEEEEEEETTDAEDSAEESSEDGDGADDTVYQPLEEVADEIRRRLANERAIDELQQKMARVDTTLEDAYVEYFDERLEAEADESTSDLPGPPETLTNLQSLAEEQELELIEFDQASQLELRETPVGRSQLTDPASGQTVPLWYLVFREEDVDAYEPVLSYGVDGAVYVTLVTQRYEAQTPELEEIRDEVVSEWKRVRAADLAKEAAAKLAEAVQSAGRSIEAYLTENPDAAPVAADAVEETDAFALLSIGQIAPNARQAPLVLSQPEPLVAAGPELLQAAVDLGAGEATAELNHDHSIAYVLRLAEQIGTEDELRQEFLRDGERWLGAATLTQSRATSKIAALLGNLLDESGLEWERTPDQVR